MSKDITGIDESTETHPSEISLDGAKIPLAVLDPGAIGAVLYALNLTPPEGYGVEKIKIVYQLAAK